MPTTVIRIGQSNALRIGGAPSTKSAGQSVRVMPRKSSPKPSGDGPKAFVYCPKCVRVIG